MMTDNFLHLIISCREWTIAHNFTTSMGLAQVRPNHLCQLAKCLFIEEKIAVGHWPRTSTSLLLIRLGISFRSICHCSYACNDLISSIVQGLETVLIPSIVQGLETVLGLLLPLQHWWNLVYMSTITQSPFCFSYRLSFLWQLPFF